jgi:carboxyl-terminal processing protease
VSADPEPHHYQLDRIAVLPQACSTPPEDTPAGNFETFAANMAAHYAFFDLHGVDWVAETQAARARIRADMTDEELFEVLAHMLRNIKDGHLSLIAEIDGARRVFEANDGATQIALQQAAIAAGEEQRPRVRAWRSHYWQDDIAAGLLNGQGVMAGNDFIQYGIVSGDIGYIAALTVGGYAERDFSDPLGDAVVLDTIMEDALARFEVANVKAVIIDLSIHFGGYDFIARSIAQRFAAAPVFAYAKSPADAARAYSTRISLEPAQGRTFTGPVYVLTSDVTVSGGEVLTMCLRALPNVTHVGAPTRGALSDILGVPLPNGWTLTMSNEVYTDEVGVLWEGRGIEPEIALDVFPSDDPINGHAAAMRSLIAMVDEATR